MKKLALASIATATNVQSARVFLRFTLAKGNRVATIVHQRFPLIANAGMNTRVHALHVNVSFFFGAKEETGLSGTFHIMPAGFGHSNLQTHVVK